jgi:hypothetical protein
LFKCKKCNKEFDHERSFSGHKGVCGKKKKCSICENLISVASFKRHQESHKNDKLCPVCGKLIRKKRNKYCSHSCAASICNIGVVRNGSKRVKGHCKNCGSEIASGKKYCTNICQQEKQYKDYISRWLKGEETGNIANDMEISSYVRRWIFENRGKKCEKCGWKEVHLDNSIPVQIDHIDADSTNTVPNNLRVLCPSCHSLTPRFGNRNKGNGRTSRYS